MKKFIIIKEEYGSQKIIDPVIFSGSWYINIDRYTKEKYLVFGVEKDGKIEYYREQLFKEVNVCEPQEKPKPKPKTISWYRKFLGE